MFLPKTAQGGPPAGSPGAPGALRAAARAIWAVFWVLNYSQRRALASFGRIEGAVGLSWHCSGRAAPILTPAAIGGLRRWSISGRNPHP